MTSPPVSAVWLTLFCPPPSGDSRALSVPACPEDSLSLVPVSKESRSVIPRFLSSIHQTPPLLHPSHINVSQMPLCSGFFFFFLHFCSSPPDPNRVSAPESLSPVSSVSCAVGICAEWHIPGEKSLRNVGPGAIACTRAHIVRTRFPVFVFPLCSIKMLMAQI